MHSKYTAVLFAILAAALYAINIPFSKLLLAQIDPVMMAAFLYLGAGLGLFLYGLITNSRKKEEPLTKKELPFTLGMIVLDIAAPIFLMIGLTRTNPANASLLNNFEIVATSLIAFFIFKELLSPKLALAILLITAASIILGFEGAGSFVFNTGSLYVLLAAACWGLENNCTRMLSSKSSVQITKGFFSGTGSFVVALLCGEAVPSILWIGAAMLLGFVAYGLSINFYIKAQKELGAAKTSAYYSIAPFLGVFFSMLLFHELPGIQFYAGLIIMILATILLIQDTFQQV